MLVYLHQRKFPENWKGNMHYYFNLYVDFITQVTLSVKFTTAPIHHKSCGAVKVSDMTSRYIKNKYPPLVLKVLAILWSESYGRELPKSAILSKYFCHRITKCGKWKSCMYTTEILWNNCLGNFLILRRGPTVKLLFTKVPKHRMNSR